MPEKCQKKMSGRSDVMSVSGWAIGLNPEKSDFWFEMKNWFT